MIAGFSGGLISHAYLEERVLPAIDGAQMAAFERPLMRWWQLVSRSLGPASSPRAIFDVAVVPLLELLGHDRPAAAPAVDGLIAPLPPGSLLITIPWSEQTSHAWRRAVGRGLASQARWVVICNGRSVRIVDCARSWTRAAIEFDFDTLMSGPKGIAALWAVARGSALNGTAKPSLRDLLIESDAHASRVCRSLGDGVLSALPALTMALAGKPRKASDHSVAFEQALTIVYRILFLLFAEARSLVPIWNGIYRDAYTIEALTARARLRSASAAESFGGSSPAEAGSNSGTGLWKTFQAISRLAHAGCKAGDLEVTAFNGRLFSPRHTPLIEQRAVADRVMRDVLLSLASAPTAHGRRRISYHDLGVEQLGSVYERVLEHEPTSAGGSIVLTRTSTRRKTTGSFYTPQALTEFLVRRTLSPLIEGKTASQILDLRVVDPAMGSGAFLVAACVFLADACEHALIRDGQWTAAEVSVGGSVVVATSGCRAMRLRRRPQSDCRAARKGVAVVDDSGRQSPADISGSPSRNRQQLDRRAAERSVSAAVQAGRPHAGRPAAVRGSDCGGSIRASNAGATAPVGSVRVRCDRQGEGAGDDGVVVARRPADAVEGRR